MRSTDFFTKKSKTHSGFLIGILWLLVCVGFGTASIYSYFSVITSYSIHYTKLYDAYRYYVLDRPIIADVEYDQLFRELLDLEGKFPDLVTTDSPSQRVGGEPLEKFNA